MVVSLEIGCCSFRVLARLIDIFGVKHAPVRKIGTVGVVTHKGSRSLIGSSDRGPPILCVRSRRLTNMVGCSQEGNMAASWAKRLVELKCLKHVTSYTKNFHKTKTLLVALLDAAHKHFA